MKLILLGLRLLAMGLLFLVFGCGGGDSDSFTRPYTLQYTFMNTSGATVQFSGRDIPADKSTGPQTVTPGPSSTASTSGVYISKAETDIRVSLSNTSGVELTHVDVSGVHIGTNKITYIYVAYDGSKLNVDATRPAGVP
ncbi:MAG: hypothetical protein QM758_15355 [Armatimonas sp.]